MKFKIISKCAAVFLVSGLLAGCGSLTQETLVSQTKAMQSESVSEAKNVSGTEAAPEESVEAEENGETVTAESVRTNGGEVIGLSALEHQDKGGESAVYFTSDISSQAMVDIYAALGAELTGDKIAVKLSTGEPPASNYLDPALIAELIRQVNGTIVENNTAYGGQRSGTAMHYQVAEDHGFTAIADFVVMDENGSVSLPVEGGTRLTESMAEAGKSVVDALDGNILYISVMNRLSIDCDCDGNPSEPDMHDIGILASTDPVALDQACVDLIYASKDDTASLIERMESRNAIHVLEHGEEIGLGTRTYRLVNCDD